MLKTRKVSVSCNTLNTCAYNVDKSHAIAQLINIGDSCMAEVTKLYLVERNTIKIFDPTDVTPKEFQAKVGLNKKLYISIYLSRVVPQRALDYSHMVTDYNLGKIETWSELTEALTDELIDGYSSELPGYEPGTVSPINYPVYWDALSTLNTFNISYSDIHSDLTNFFAFRWNLKDLKFELQKDPLEVPNLKNCIPIVNGFICRPVYHPTRECLYAKEGAHLCWQQGVHRTPEASLVDMTKLGGYFVEEIKFNGDPERFTSLKVLSVHTDFDTTSDWVIHTPHNLNEVTPILVIAGIPLLPDQYQVLSPHSLKFNLRILPLHYALAFRQYLYAQTNSNADIAYSTLSLQDYLYKQVTIKQDELSPDTFVIYVKSPKLYVTREHLDVWNKNLVMNLYTEEGLLQHNATGCIRSYHMEEYSDRKELTIQNMEDFYVADMKYQEEQLAFINPRCNHHSFVNLQTSKMTMLYIMR